MSDPTPGSPAPPPPEPRPTIVFERRLKRATWATLALVVAGVGAVAWVLLSSLHRDYLATQDAALSTVADLKAREVTAWLGERLADARVLARAGVPDGLSTATCATPGAPDATWIGAIREAYAYDAVLVLDGSGRVVCTVPHGADPAPHPATVEAARALGEVRVSPPFVPPGADRLLIDVVVPRVPTARAVAAGPVGPVPALLVLRADLGRVLLPALGTWPVPSPTAETLLLAKDGGEVVYLSTPRGTSAPTRTMRSPLAGGADEVATGVVEGSTGPRIGRDRGGVEVRYVGRPIPGVPWFVAVKVDQAELSAPLRARVWTGLAFAGLVLGLVYLGAGRMRRSAMARWQQGRLAEAEARADLARSYRTMFEDSPIAYQALDAEGRIVEVNPAWLRFTGHDRDAVLGKPFAGLLAPGSAEVFHARLPRLLEDGEIRGIEFELRRADGRTVWCSFDGRVGRDEAGSPGRVHWISSDITDRMRSDQRLREHQASLRSLASQLTLVEERERRRIAVDLHDNVGQTLGLCRIRLGALGRAAQDVGLAVPVREVTDLVEQAIRLTRSLTFELSPPALYEFGLGAAIEGLVRLFRERTGIEVTLEGTGESMNLSGDVSVLLFSAARELLFNVEKHAHATRVAVRLQRVGAEVRLVVEDDGTGFTGGPVGEAHRDTDGFGLFGIRERLSPLGGGMEVDSAPGRGTRVTLRAPQKWPRSIRT